jgi:hypothetical protein
VRSSEGGFRESPGWLICRYYVDARARALRVFTAEMPPPLMRDGRKFAGHVRDVVPARDETVWEALYEIGDDELTAIDRKEGCGWAYTRVMCPVLLEVGGQGQVAVVYTVLVEEPAQVVPSRQYLHRLIAAAHERRLPKAYVEKLEGVVAR